jgi:hypothetical protein
MGARFYKGASVKVTETTRAPAGQAQHKASTIKSGMPGYIKTGQDTSSSGLASSKGVGPHREGPVGKKGGHNGNFLNKAGQFGGSSDKSYRATSTGPAGKVRPNADNRGKMESLRGRAKFSMEK